MASGGSEAAGSIGAGNATCKKLLQSANESYETLLNTSGASSAAGDGCGCSGIDGIASASGQPTRPSSKIAKAGEQVGAGSEPARSLSGTRRGRPDLINGGSSSLPTSLSGSDASIASTTSVVSVQLPVTASVLAVVGSNGLHGAAESSRAGAAALSTRTASLKPHEYTHITSDSIRQLQDIRGSLRHVLHSDLAGVEELLVRKLATIRRQEASTDLVPKNAMEITTMVNSSLHSENELLRNTLDRERLRRKQYEKQTETLQDRLGEEHQQFTSALEALKRKDGMIEQLDKTLAKVVEGWQINEVEHQRTVRDMEKSHSQLSRELSEQRELSAGLEVELAAAIDDLAKEHERTTLASLEKSSRIQSMDDELSALSEKLESSRSTCHQLELERSEASESRDRAAQQLSALYATVAEERKVFQEREQELLAKIDEISGTQICVLENEQRKAVELGRNVTDLETRLCSTLQTVESLTVQLKESELDKEKLACDITTLKEKHKAQLKQQESDLKLQTADMVLRQRQEWAERLSGRETELAAAQRKQASELHERHARQISELTARHHSETAELRMRYQAQCTELGNKIDRLEEEVHQLRYSKRRMEAQYKEIASRLQSMMTMHTAEALKILTAVPPQGGDSSAAAKLPTCGGGVVLNGSSGEPTTDGSALADDGPAEGRQTSAAAAAAAAEKRRHLQNGAASPPPADGQQQCSTDGADRVHNDGDGCCNVPGRAGSDEPTKGARKLGAVELQAVAPRLVAGLAQEHILPIELDAYGLTSFKPAPSAPGGGRHDASRLHAHAHHLVDVLARQEARNGHAHFTPTTEEFLAYLRETQTTTKDKLNDEDECQAYQS